MILLVFASMFATDYWRCVPIDLEWLRRWRDEVVAAFASEDMRQLELTFLTLYLIGLLFWLYFLRRRLVGDEHSNGQAHRSEPHKVRQTPENSEDAKGGIENRLLLCASRLGNLFCSKDAWLRTACLAGFCVCTLGAYFLGEAKGRESNDLVVCFWGLVVGQGFLLVMTLPRATERALEFQENVLNSLALLLTIAALVQPNWWQPHYQYRGHLRWQGLWWNPNTFGILMALGIILAVGLVVYRSGSTARGRSLRWRNQEQEVVVRNPMFEVKCLGTRLGYWFRRALLLIAVAMMAVGLMRSYSRAAWAGILLGLAYLAWHSRILLDDGRASQVPGDPDTQSGNGEPFVIRSLRLTTSLAGALRNRFALAAIMGAIVVLVFWNCRDTESPVVRRAFSVGNMNDLSWRNRLVAYEGALQMMATKPWFGFGWNQAEETYDKLFKPSKVVEPNAIVLNDYFMIGMTLGLPALACFVGYVSLSLRPKSRNRKPGAMGLEREYGRPKLEDQRREAGLIQRGKWLRVVCRAGVVVLLVAFWLQRGVFFLALGVPFWVLLELGMEEDPIRRRQEWIRDELGDSSLRKYKGEVCS